MANRLTDEKAQAIAVEYYDNGFKKVLALLTLGYSKTYASSKTGLQIYDKPNVKAALLKIKNAGLAKTGYSIEQAQQEYEQARVLAMDIRQPAAASTAVTGKARLFGFDKDSNIGEKTIIIISPKVSKVIESVPVEPIDEER